MKINVQRRYASHGLGARGRYVYDADGDIDGVEYNVCGARTKADAQLEARCQVAFKRQHGGVSACGFQLYATHVETFVLVFPHGGSHGFGARSLRDALLRVAREYNDHVPVQCFVSIVLAQAMRDEENAQ